MKRKRFYVLLLLVIIAIQGMVVLTYWNREAKEGDRKRNEIVWSTLAGAADGRQVLDATMPVVQQHFISQHENLNGMTVFFYHCDKANSGQVYVELKDLSGKEYFEYKFEPLYMTKEVFCLSLKPEEGILLKEGEEYILEIRTEAMAEEDFVEIGTTLTASKPSVYLEMEDGNTLFLGLDYT